MPKLTRDETITEFVNFLEKLSVEEGFEKCIEIFTELYDAKSQIRNLQISLDSKVASYEALLRVVNTKESDNQKENLENLKIAEAELKAKEANLKKEPTFN